uniref:Uncharacterized protein n=1 Tax=Dromedary stool-associated circular ssDNA virus TaxID=1574422 RepID=A0A0A1EIS1_9VIRU|nr:hypothetical protein [Dromedary stool-associated circular ssDNA virus]
MPNTVSFQVGTAYTKKRKRMPGTNNVNKAEIKQWNPRSFGEGNTYNGVNIWNVLDKTLWSVVNSSSWLPRPIYMPTQGSGSYQRIGSKIFLKYLRFKGYISVFWRNLIGVRWRLRLLRCDNYLFKEVTDGTTAQAAIIQYLDLLKNHEHPTSGSEEWSVASTVWDNCRHNFYKSVKDVNDRNVIRSKVIASGYIPVSAPAELVTLGGALTGNAAGAITLSGYNTTYDINNTRYAMPLDVKVKCNDYVDDSVSYYYVLETDCGIGISYTSANGAYASLATAGALFQLSFFIRGYFTDS